MGGCTLGPCTARNSTADVAILIAPMPGSMAPTPKNSTVVSLEPQTTGVPAASPVSPAAFGVTAPTTSLGFTTRGNVSNGQSIKAQSSADQLLVRSSAIKAPTAS